MFIVKYLKMRNPRPNISGLKPPKWNNVPTVPIRVPAVFKDYVLRYARSLDKTYRVADKYQELEDTVVRLTTERSRLLRKIEALESDLEQCRAINDLL